MGLYRVKSPDGRTVILRGETPPTDADIDDIFASLEPPKPIANAPQSGSPSYGGSEGLKRLAIGGIPGYATAPGSEDVLPSAGQTIGGLIPGINAFGGSVAGAAIGEVGKQTVKGLREGRMPDYKSVIPSTATTAITEGVFRGIPKALFPKQLGGKAREAAGKVLGEIRENVTKKAPFLRMAKNDIIKRIDDALNSAPFESGPQRQALIRIKNRLIGKGKPLTFDESVQLEQQMGREAQFASEATQGRFAKGPKAPRSNQALKAERSIVSKNVDNMAAQAGFPELDMRCRI